MFYLLRIAENEQLPDQKRKNNFGGGSENRNWSFVQQKRAMLIFFIRPSKASTRPEKFL